jgi:hypothetical protein
MENDKFDRETIDKYLEILVKKYPKIDLHLLEYVVASYLLYDVEKREKPTEENEDFTRANKVIEELIERSHSRAPASEQREKINKESSDL